MHTHTFTAHHITRHSTWWRICIVTNAKRSPLTSYKDSNYHAFTIQSFKTDSMIAQIWPRGTTQYRKRMMNFFTEPPHGQELPTWRSFEQKIFWISVSWCLEFHKQTDGWKLRTFERRKYRMNFFDHLIIIFIRRTQKIDLKTEINEEKTVFSRRLMTRSRQ